VRIGRESQARRLEGVWRGGWLLGSGRGGGGKGVGGGVVSARGGEGGLRWGGKLAATAGEPPAGGGCRRGEIKGGKRGRWEGE